MAGDDFDFAQAVARHLGQHLGGEADGLPGGIDEGDGFVGDLDADAQARLGRNDGRETEGEEQCEKTRAHESGARRSKVA